MKGYSLYQCAVMTVEEAFGSNARNSFVDSAPDGVDSPSVFKDYILGVARASGVTTVGHHVAYLSSTSNTNEILRYFKFYIVPDILNASGRLIVPARQVA